MNSFDTATKLVTRLDPLTCADFGVVLAEITVASDSPVAYRQVSHTSARVIETDRTILWR